METGNGGAWSPQAAILAIEAGILRVTAPNPGPMTDKGTNAYVVGDADRCFIVDPGPGDPRQLEALALAVAGRTVEAILVTHRHADHVGLVAMGAERFAAPVFAAPAASADRSAMAIERSLDDGERLSLGGETIAVVATPGHTADHLAFALDGRGLLLTGDHVMGWSTSVIIPPEGRMADYRASLHKLLARADRAYLPGHGEPVDNPSRLVRGFLTHRAQRETSILAALGERPRDLAALVAAVYPALPDGLATAARASTRAHLIQLFEEGRLAGDPHESDGPFALPAS